MPLEKLVFTVVLGFVAIWLLDVTLRRRWELPKEKERIYYSKAHRILFHTLMGASFFATLIVSFLISNGLTALEIILLPLLTSGATAVLKGFMEWKHAENRNLYKATMINTIGSAIIVVLMTTTIIEGLNLSS